MQGPAARRSLCWGAAPLLVKAPDRGGPGSMGERSGEGGETWAALCNQCFPNSLVQLHPVHLLSCSHSRLHIPSLKDHLDYCLLLTLLPVTKALPPAIPSSTLVSRSEAHGFSQLPSPHPNPTSYLLSASRMFLRHCTSVCHAHPFLCCCLTASFSASCFSAFMATRGDLYSHIRHLLGWLPVVLDLNLDVLLA